MISKLTIQAEIDRENGRLNIDNRARFIEQLKSFADTKVEVVIRRRPEFRSQKQLAYYWSVVIKACQHGFELLGTQYTQKETHEDLKSRFLFKEKAAPITGEPIRVYMSLSEVAQEVDKRVMTDYIEKIKQFASEHLAVYIPEANEQHADAEFKR